MGTWIGIGLSHVFGGSKSKFLSEVKAYFTRVFADSGTVEDEKTTNDTYKFLKSEGLDTDTKLLWFAEGGIKTHATTVSSTPLTFVSKGYSLDPTPNDLTQTTELNQPYLSGNIAPNERYGVSFKNTRGFDHTTINFTALQSWSVTFVIKDYESDFIKILCGSSLSGFYVGGYSSRRYYSWRLQSNSSYIDLTDNQKYKNKTVIHSITADATTNTFNYYINGEFINTFNAATEQDFSRLGLTSNIPDCICKYYRIQSGAMTEAQVQAEHTLLRSMYPEIESVQIGTQTWATSNLEMVVTPIGNLIQEVQDAGDWAYATDIYNMSISEGATEDEAIQEAAMWCYPNNDPNLGAVYGKLYNWYAAKLIQNDIDAYNVANPSTPWGWRVPTQADFNTLATTLGGTSVAGGKMKVGGLDYWSQTDSTVNNESGFSLLGSGWRTDTSFFGIRINGPFRYSDNSNTFGYVSRTNSLFLNAGSGFIQYGTPIRLIKDE